MQKKNVDKQFDSWFSTYGLLTVERVLEHLSIRIPHEKMIQALSNPKHLLHKVLRVPVLNIFNGIIFQQAYDYQVYAQKLMIDYRLSPEYAKDPESPGANIRADLNEQYERLLNLVKAFSDHQYQHYRVISESQAYLIEHIGQLNDPINELGRLYEDDEFTHRMREYEERTEEMTLTFRSFRQQFYDMILVLSERLASLSEYKFDVAQAEKERESLFFDKKIGEE